eukprot:TRINITY_DN6710_c0_g1_i2.p1 TRINITY_DN6710_c0_g1~~TRINITY_DN6710_c0_g1_i2.p1  ORF type:complete len:134 (+),score=22.78 TRINITY_DN6710_c0_g1_i2:58-459(+)
MKTRHLNCMRLLTHNLLCGPKGGYPLRLKVTELEELEAEFEADFVRRLIAKLEWSGLLSALEDLKQQGFYADLQLPSTAPPLDCTDDAVLKALHKVVNEIKVKEGTLECPVTHTIFPIADGIPKMIYEEGDTA